ncbi:hypothetical protein FEAC_26910 [Ferrimicrobium acidiphilum DSM 19497]|uniref:Uncharacterized protein n=1 Tax=Ferrimicrobium acidiphilum DSM 19497 TaxID=1121877 RepID=A0A0D8FQI7_9ACTN|nr:hypothetical protein FEAC_26910 [Ferrimicrobium acidiphilum DSM 19497]
MRLSQISLDGFNILVVAQFAHYAHAHKLSPTLVKSIAGRNRGLGSSSIYLFHSTSAQQGEFHRQPSFQWAAVSPEFHSNELNQFFD